jgi:hypothetical protein
LTHSETATIPPANDPSTAASQVPTAEATAGYHPEARTHPALRHISRTCALLATAAAGALIMGLASGAITAQPPTTPEYRVQVSQDDHAGASAVSTVVLGPGGMPTEVGTAFLRFKESDVALVVQSRTDGGEWEPVTPRGTKPAGTPTDGKE